MFWVGLDWYVLLWIFLVLALPVCFMLALVKVWHERERKGGKRDDRPGIQ